MGIKVISFSLWGDGKDYTIGAIKNLELADKVYPGWHTYFYVHNKVSDDIINKLTSKKDNNKVIFMDSDVINSDAMFWRFLPLIDPEVDVFISRDCDSRLNDKEFQAVSSWLSSDKQFHCMRDHVYHAYPAVLGGMWGCKNFGILNPRWLLNFLVQFKQGNYGNDQNGLNTFYEMYKNLFMEHDDRKNFKGVPFPEHKPFEFGSFIGERITWDGMPGKL